MAGFLYALMPASRSGFLPFMKRKIDTLLWPLLFGTFAFWAVWVFAYGGNDSLLEMLRSGRPHFWYLHALLLWFLVVALLDSVLPMTNLAWLAVLLFSVVGWLLVPHPKIVDDLFSPDLFPMFIIGMFLYRMPRSWSGPWQWLAGLAIFSAFLYVDSYYPTLLDPRAEKLFRLLASTGSIIFIMKCFPRIGLIEGIAFYSFTIYLWHLPVIFQVQHFLYSLGIHSVPVHFLLGVSFGVLVPTLLHKLVEHLPLPVRVPLIGR
jgi:peptidoglycan/LPS O-acetylase OafA/YrhL